MEATVILETKSGRQINTEGKPIANGFPHFIVIKKSENKKIRIPCVNEKVAEKLLSIINKRSIIHS